LYYIYFARIIGFRFHYDYAGIVISLLNFYSDAKM